MVDALAQRYGVVPSVILDEPASILRLVAVAEEGRAEINKK
tara:strand:- start:1412 stop:1534 length:123 start_codon:yes stop_codon:yes gene_type:complete